MISFQVLTPEKKGNASRLFSLLSDEERECAEELLSSFISYLEENSECEMAISLSSGCLLLRTYDGEYSFAAPFMLSENADFSGALIAISEYAVKEEIDLIISDLDSEMLSLLEELFLNTEVYEAEEDCFIAKIKSELELLAKVPRVQKNGIVLTKLSENDISEYARLSREETGNRYWGYDYRLDVVNPDDAYFYNRALLDYKNRIALTLAVRRDDVFVGEAVIYAFDFRGGAEVAIRILPEHRGGGIGGSVLSLLISLARKIGLRRLVTRIHPDNTGSVKMVSKYMNKTDERDGRIIFTVEL